MSSRIPRLFQYDDNLGLYAKEVETDSQSNMLAHHLLDIESDLNITVACTTQDAPDSLLTLAWITSIFASRYCSSRRRSWLDTLRISETIQIEAEEASFMSTRISMTGGGISRIKRERNVAWRFRTKSYEAS